MSTRSTLIGLALVGAAVVPGTADASVSCSYDQFNTHNLTVTMTAAGDGATISRSGNAIEINGNGCNGASVTNTAAIVWDDQSLGGTTAALDLTGGALAPGYNPQVGDPSPAIGMTYKGSSGNDTFEVFGGAADDRFRIGSGASDSFVNLDAGAEGYFPDADIDLKSVEIADLNGGGGNDVLDAGSHNETGGSPFGGTLYLEGAAGDDSLTGGSGMSELVGGIGNDLLTAGTGQAALDPGTGDDTAVGAFSSHATVSYSDAPAGVHVDLAHSGSQDTGSAGNDYLSGFDVLIGSPFDDVLSGNEGSQSIEGGSGNDTLMGRGGNDALKGGGGIDVVSYAEPSPGVTTGVTVSLATQGSPQDTGSEGKDQLSGISGVIGSPFADALTGDAAANRIDGGGGADTISSGDGADTLLLRDGISDHADCGGATDTVESDPAGLDVLSGCENVAFAPFAGQPVEDGGTGGGPTGLGAADTALTFHFTAKARQKLGRRGIVKGSLLCPDEACTGDVSAKLAIGHTARSAGHKTIAVQAGTPKAVKLRLSARNLRRARAALRRGARVTMKVTAVAHDAAGNRRAVTRKVTLGA